MISFASSARPRAPVGPALPTLLLLLLVLLVPSRADAADGDVVGVVVKLSGTASVVRGGADVALGLGDPILVGDQLQTAADSALGVTLKDNSLLSLGPRSTFELTDFVLDPVAGVFSLGGRIISGSMVITTGEIGKIAPDNVSFETPFGVIGIRGTKFAVTVS